MSFVYSARRLVVMVLKDAQFNVMGVMADVIAIADHRALPDVILGCVQSGNQGHGVRYASNVREAHFCIQRGIGSCGVSPDRPVETTNDADAETDELTDEKTNERKNWERKGERTSARTNERMSERKNEHGRTNK